MRENIILGAILLVVLVILWRETKSWFGFLDRQNAPDFKEGEEEDKDS